MSMVSRHQRDSFWFATFLAVSAVYAAAESCPTAGDPPGANFKTSVGGEQTPLLGYRRHPSLPTSDCGSVACCRSTQPPQRRVEFAAPNEIAPFYISDALRRQRLRRERVQVEEQ